MMTKCITSKEIVSFVKKAIKKANNVIWASMDLAEELQNPLPASYFQLLQKKVFDGVVLKRLVFGNKTLFTKFIEKNLKWHACYQLKLVSSSNYKRMIMIDHKIIFFQLDGQFFMSNDPQKLQEYEKYFTKLWDHFNEIL